MKAIGGLTVLIVLALLGWLFLRAPRAPLPSAARSAVPAASCPRGSSVAARRPFQHVPDQVRWLFVGAADSPALNQVSLEQDGELVRRVLGPSGLFLSAGGPGAHDVQVQRTPSDRGGDPFLAELADLIAPHAGRDSRYRPSRLPIHAAATIDEVRATLSRLLRAGRAPLLLYLGGHGEQGETARQSYVTLWAGHQLTVERLAGLLDSATRPVRLVVAVCYGGAFAETVFRGADPRQGAASSRCGFFATMPDLPATGCDPNPDRKGQEGYALHFFHALAGQDRGGKPLLGKAVDFDGDGRVSLAEAHARTRIDLDSVDVPISTSERWLREVAPRKGPRRALPLPEERAVVHALARRTGLPEELEACRRELAEREREIEEALRRLDQASAAVDETVRAAIGDLLVRWPVLDDPWHPDFAELLRCQRQEIESHLRASRAYAHYLEARKIAQGVEDEYWALRHQAAPVERLARALETIELAERLHAQPGASWDSYAAILACERGGPPPVTPAAAEPR
jgi:hypothetical protein